MKQLRTWRRLISKWFALGLCFLAISFICGAAMWMIFFSWTAIFLPFEVYWPSLVSLVVAWLMGIGMATEAALEG